MKEGKRLLQRCIVMIMAGTAISLAACQIRRQEPGNNDFAAEQKAGETQPLNSNIPKEKCCLCGETSKSLAVQCGRSKALGVICLNDFSVIELPTGASRENYSAADLPEGASILLKSLGGMMTCVRPDLDRQYCTADISVKEHEWYADLEKVSRQLCQECLERAYQEPDFTDTPVPNFLIVDLATLELYPLTKAYLSFSVNDYLVLNNQTANEIHLMVFYLPIKD